MNLLLVAMGGAIGSVARYLLSALILRLTGVAFPVGTFVVNVVGCLVFGAILGTAQHRVALTQEARAFLFVGLLGGFTTFSSYAFESVGLLREGALLEAGVNVVGQVVLGLAALWAGVVMGSLA